MSEVKIRHKKDSKKVQELLLHDVENGIIDMEGIENVLQEDANIFLLNNLMMSVQFFENYERDIKLLRENWFKEFSLDPHHKRCFYADSLFRLSGANVRFSPRHGVNKNIQSPLHPFRIYITSDNMEAAFDPSALGRSALKVWPEYQLTVNTEKKSEKSGCIKLVEFKTILEPNRAKTNRKTYGFESSQPHQRASIYIQNRNEEKSTRKLTKTETTVAFQNRELSLRLLGKRCSLRYTPTPDGTIPANGFYKFDKPETRLKRKKIYDWRMNTALETSHEIPQFCFQYEEVPNTIRRRTELDSCFRTRKVLNSAAFKAYFCDLLIEKLGKSLSLDSEALDESTLTEEFIVVNQNGAEHCITPVITIRDWYKYVDVRRFRNDQHPETVLWPSRYMQKIMEILPCNAVPTFHGCPSAGNMDYEKSWKLVFPKTEEFLLLHMMHAHVRCYFFVLLIYKSFIEPHVNVASFGPKHLMHLLFWKVHKDFLAWPEDRPAETLLNYLKTLYKKLQNKRLRDFFITSRNLFANSLQKDLHMAQSLLKRIIENPVPYIIRAISYLNLHEDFYPPFDYSQLNRILTDPPIPEKIKKIIKKEKRKKVHFKLDEEQLWKKNVIKQIELEKKAEKKEEAAKLSVESVNVNKMLNFDSNDWEKCIQILQMFTFHFLQMGTKSIEHNCLPQGLTYLYQSQRLFQLMVAKGMTQENLKDTQEQINQLKQFCCNKIKQELRKSPEKPKKFPEPPPQKQERNAEIPKTTEQEIHEATEHVIEESEESEMVSHL